MSTAIELVNLHPHPVVIESDAECRAIAAEIGLVLTDPGQHANNQAWHCFAYSGYYWVLINHTGHPDPEDNGLLMFGIPKSAGEPFFRNFVRECLEEHTFGIFDSDAFAAKPIPQF